MYSESHTDIVVTDVKVEKLIVFHPYIFAGSGATAAARS